MNNYEIATLYELDLPLDDFSKFSDWFLPLCSFINCFTYMHSQHELRFLVYIFILKMYTIFGMQFPCINLKQGKPDFVMKTKSFFHHAGLMRIVLCNPTPKTLLFNIEFLTTSD